MTSLASRVEPVVAQADALAKKYIPEPYYTQGSEAVKTAYSSAEKAVSSGVETASKTRADVEKRIAETQERAISTAKASYDTYVPVPVKQTVESTLAAAAQTREAVVKKAEETHKYVSDTQAAAYATVGAAPQAVLAKATEASTAAYKAAEPYIIPVQAKIKEIIQTYHLDERVAQIIKQYSLDQRAAEIVTYLESKGVPVPVAIKQYLPVAVHAEEPKANGSH